MAACKRRGGSGGDGGNGKCLGFVAVTPVELALERTRGALSGTCMEHCVRGSTGQIWRYIGDPDVPSVPLTSLPLGRRNASLEEGPWQSDIAFAASL
jgi:hypothetical protein